MTNFSHEFAKANELLVGARSILITVHERPDGDALGSMCGLLLYLKSLGKTVYAVTESIPRYLEFLPGIHNVILKEVFVATPKAFDCLIACDFGDAHRSPIFEIIECSKEHNIPIISFDHHTGHTGFGAVNIVEVDCVSTTALITKFFLENDIIITPDIATCLLTGIITDSGHFFNANTTHEALSLASELVRLGAHVYPINQNTMRNKTIAEIKFFGAMLSKIRYNRRLRVAYVVIRREDLSFYGVTEEAIEGIPGILVTLEACRAIMVLRELSDGRIRGSFRTMNDSINVAKLAGYFGGGGHVKASGFTINAQLVDGEAGWKII